MRIEDTDQERKVPGAVRFILEELDWFGITPDEAPDKGELKQMGEDWAEAPNIGGAHGPYTQSLRLPRYREVAEELIAKGAAYRCDCTSEMLERERNEQLARKEVPGYSGYCRNRNVPREAKHVVRFKMPLKGSVALDDKVKGRTPTGNQAPTTGAVTKEQFEKMNYLERLELKQKNLKLYESLL